MRRARVIFQDWESAQHLAEFLAKATGHRHRVKTVPPSPVWPWHQWRVIPLATLTPARAFDALLDADTDVVLTPPLVRGRFVGRPGAVT